MPLQTAPVSSTRLLHLTASSALAIVLLALIFFATIRYRLRDMPLERDEGEYAYSGQLLLQGIPPYKLAYNMKLPGIYAAYAGILATFGETPAGIHLGLLVVNAAAILLLYFLVASLFGRLAGVVASFTYALLSTSTSVMGFEAHATNFVVPFALMAILFLLAALRSGRWCIFFLSGLSAGIAILMKQHGLFFALFCVFYLFRDAWKDRNSKPRATAKTTVRRTAIFSAGVILPYASACFLLYRAGVFRQFWFWTVSYAGEYSKVGLRRGLHAFFLNFAAVAHPAVFIWILAALGLSALFWGVRARQHSGFVPLFLLFSFLSLCPGAYFRPHYFILLLPVTAMLVGIAVGSLTEQFANRSRSPRAYLPFLAFLAAFASAVYVQRQTYFFMKPAQVFEATYGVNNAFEPVMHVAEYLKANSPPDAQIAVLGSEPEIYFYAQRHSATGYIYMYSLIGRQKYTAQMRAQMMRELQTNRPQYLVYVDVWDSWGERTGQPQAAGFLAWLDQFKNQNYETVGVADINPELHGQAGSQTTYVWGDAVKTYHPQSSSVIYVLKDSSPH